MSTSTTIEHVRAALSASSQINDTSAASGGDGVRAAALLGSLGRHLGFTVEPVGLLVRAYLPADRRRGAHLDGQHAPQRHLGVHVPMLDGTFVPSLREVQFADSWKMLPVELDRLTGFDLTDKTAVLRARRMTLDLDVELRTSDVQPLWRDALLLRSHELSLHASAIAEDIVTGAGITTALEFTG